MDKVFQEEERHLAETEKIISGKAFRLDASVSRLSKEIAEFVVYDKYDLERKQELIRQKSTDQQAADWWHSMEPSPYFGRLDLDREVGDGIETTTHYIGKEAISDSANVIVVDWRSPIGNLIHVKNQKNFNVNGVEYILALRRSLDIRNGQLVNCNTEYDGESISLDGDVIDPFLLTVLKDKRRHNRLTDIIRTIQGNQNEIIRKPRGESFVVQGCAGSGKTMILLHRLSYLKFNNRAMSLANVKIITPNKFFDAHINDLSIELGLNAIERFSVEEYYVHLIRKYSSKVTVDSDVQSEKILSTDLLSDIYSLQYLNESIAHYHAYWDQTLAMLQESKLRGYYAKFGLSFPDTSLHTAATVSLIEQVLRQMASIISDTEKKRKALVQRLETISSEMNVIQGELDKSKTLLANAKSQTISRIELETAAIENSIRKSEEKIDALKSKQAEIQDRRRTIEKELRQATAIVSLFSGDGVSYSDYDQFVLRNDAASKLISREHSEIIRVISEAETTYQKTPVYNFGKRSALRKQITERKSQFARDVATFVTTQQSSAEQKITELRGVTETLNREFNAIGETIRAAEKNIRSQKTNSSAFAECLEMLNYSEMPDTQNALTLSTHKLCAQILTSYEGQRLAVYRLLRRLDSFENTKADIEREQVQLAQNTYTKEDATYIADCIKILKKLQLSEITRNVMFKDLLNRYRLHKQSYQKTNYRHKIYLKLLYCALYFARPMNPDTFLNIDEAQDISIAEYHLLRLILGEKCVFNLYGDINQSVYSYKGIVDWDDIANITAGNIYVLNENYRNTLQITDFCNNEFGAEVYPIGISGEAVLETDTAAAVKWLLELKKSSPDSRVAIIHRHGLKAIQDCLHLLLAEQDVSWYSVDDKKLSVLSVETAKGLEFEAVVAIVDQMSDNEKYISYTRALDRLAVVRDKYSNELDITDAQEEIDEEFVPSDEMMTVSHEDTLQIRKELYIVLSEIMKQKAAMQPEQLQDNTARINTHVTGRFFSWEILNETTAVKTCDKSFFEHNETGVPREISWFFDSGSIQRGESKKINFVFNGECYSGKVSCEASEHARMRVTWNTELGELLRQFRDIETSKAVFQKSTDDTYSLVVVSTQEELHEIRLHGIALSGDESSNSGVSGTVSKPVSEDFVNIPALIEHLSTEDTLLIAEFNSILEERFGSEHKLSSLQQNIVLTLYHGKSVACNAPSGSMKSVILYLLALKEHQISGKQTLLTADAHLQENELVLADKLGLKGGIISTMGEFYADFKKDKYDVIFVSYDFFRQPENVAPFADYFAEKIAYWGLDHPASAHDIWVQLNNCGAAIETVIFLMAKVGFADLDLSRYKRIDIDGNIELGIAKKHTFFSPEEKLKWLLENLDELYGQGIVYCNNEASCKLLCKHLRKQKVMAEAYIDVTNPEKRARINYLTNSFSNGGLPVLVTTHEAGKNLSNPHIRFIIHYDIPEDEELYQLHIMQVGQLADNSVVHDLQAI